MRVAAHRADAAHWRARADPVRGGLRPRNAARTPAPPPSGLGPQDRLHRNRSRELVWSALSRTPRSASGEIYDMEKLTAAHRRLPFQTWVEVTNLSNGKHVDVRITDRGPFVEGRIIDLSLAAAREIDMVGAGTARVRLKVIVAPVSQPPVNALENPSTSCGRIRGSGGGLLRSRARRSLACGAALLRCESG